MFNYLLQNRLLESLAKFQEYEDTVESIKRNLDALEPQISKEVDTHAPSLADSQKQIERVRVCEKAEYINRGDN